MHGALLSQHGGVRFNAGSRRRCSGTRCEWPQCATQPGVFQTRFTALGAGVEDVEREILSFRGRGLRCAAVAYSCLLATQLDAKQYASQMQ